MNEGEKPYKCKKKKLFLLNEGDYKVRDNDLDSSITIQNRVQFLLREKENSTPLVR